MKGNKSYDIKQDLIENSGYKDCFSLDPQHDTELEYVESGGYLIEEGCSPTKLIYLARGRAKLYTSLANGKVALIDFFCAPCFVGEMELIDPHHQTFSVQAIESCWCLTLPMKQYRAQLKNDVMFLRTLCTFLIRKNLKNITTSIQNQFYPLDNRLAAFILLSQYGDVYNEKHSQVAEYMGVSYRHLLYVLAKFTRDGVLVKCKGGYEIVDRLKLEQIALKMLPNGIS